MSNSHNSSPPDPHGSPTSITSDPLVLKYSTMPPIDRSADRNVHIYNDNDRTTGLGGLILNPGVTNANFYAMIRIFVEFERRTFSLRNQSGIEIQKDHQPLQPGNYYIVTSGWIRVTAEIPLVRTISLQTGTRTRSFGDAVRSRDGRCVITGRPAPSAASGRWGGLQAAHIFPLAYEGHWVQSNYPNLITIPAASEGAGSINSVQNGLLLRNDIHHLFDSYDFSINPDDNHKIVCFSPDVDGIAGGRLDQRLLSHRQRPIDELLRWHFRQAVLTNMKGAGEPIFEHDFPPGSDMMGQILRGPRAADRMEFELFGRLAAHVVIDSFEGAEAVVTDGIYAYTEKCSLDQLK